MGEKWVRSGCVADDNLVNTSRSLPQFEMHNCKSITVDTKGTFATIKSTFTAANTNLTQGSSLVS